ncbi:uncharacterized protein LOC129802746 [Phlebotomus papatasi]|uniref:uncharacterized protein LOC129802746 n=1 Tax=Phlebotomus papatasi TaxID=29031 RepID=UPI002483616C|nr:uncharacterized protein LOC129802746 [Phlebotomus papatasi]
MLLYTFLFISILIPAFTAERVEICVCCDEEIGQSISDKCDIAAKSINEEEQKVLQELCEERKSMISIYDTYQQNQSPSDLNYLILKDTKIDSVEYPSEDCEKIFNNLKSDLFWVSGDRYINSLQIRDIISRKQISSNHSDSSIYELLKFYGYGYENIPLSSNPKLRNINGTYEYLMKITPQLQTIHDIEYFKEKKVLSAELVTLGYITVGDSELKDHNHTHYVKVPKRTRYNFDGYVLENSELKILDENNTFAMKSDGTIEEIVIKKLDVNTYFMPGWYLTEKVLGRWVNTEKQFTAKIIKEFLKNNNQLTMEEIITGTRIESVIEVLDLGENAVYNEDYWYRPFGQLTLSVSDRAMAGMLFTLAGVLILGVIFFLLKKCCSCCFRTPVEPGYQRLDETITAAST